MISLLLQGYYTVFVVIITCLVFSLTLHEFGHAMTAKLLGDDTAERAGRLTLNPAAHIDLVGLLMVVLVGFGYAKPVPFNPNNIRHAWGGAAVAIAGPLMNLLQAMVAVNIFAWAVKTGAFEMNEVRGLTLGYFAMINLLLMLFNLIPMGPLDGHYIMSWLLPKHLRSRYDYINDRYGSLVFIGLILA